MAWGVSGTSAWTVRIDELADRRIGQGEALDQSVEDLPRGERRRGRAHSCTMLETVFSLVTP